MKNIPEPSDGDAPLSSAANGSEEESSRVFEKKAKTTKLLTIGGFSAILVLIFSLIFFQIASLKKQLAFMEGTLVSLEKGRQSFNMLKTTFPGVYELSIVAALDDFFEVDKRQQEFNKGSRDFLIARDKIIALGLDEEEKKLFQDLAASVERARPLIHSTFAAAGDAMGAPDLEKRRAGLVAKVEAAIGPYDDVVKAIERIAVKQIGAYKGKIIGIEENLDRTIFLLIALGLGAIVISGLIALFVVKRESASTTELINEVHIRRQAELAAELATRTKSNFLANMSHELRTPLNAILGFSEMFLNETFGPLGHGRYKEYAADIHHSGVHLLSLINDILDVSAIEAGKFELHEDFIDLFKLIDRSLRIIRPKATQGRIVLETSTGGDVPMIRADARRCRQMLLNLLSNAIKFTPPDGRVKTETRRGEDGTISITVSDTGVGMDEDGMKKALIPFGMVRRAYDGKHEGTGLGLPLTKFLIEAHNGHLEIKSAPGKGTAVTLIFPTARVVRNNMFHI
ncbi:MAG TPA: HAMP domain-containing histidine kinase [Rhodospirillales bacterium]|mgnify:CR=1 FL=1|nr:HAMP domain-containing histidine kinase [Rhodospirillales bacterium]